MTHAETQPFHAPASKPSAHGLVCLDTECGSKASVPFLRPPPLPFRWPVQPLPHCFPRPHLSPGSTVSSGVSRGPVSAFSPCQASCILTAFLHFPNERPSRSPAKPTGTSAKPSASSRCSKARVPNGLRSRWQNSPALEEPLEQPQNVKKMCAPAHSKAPVRDPCSSEGCPLGNLLVNFRWILCQGRGCSQGLWRVVPESYQGFNVPQACHCLIP